MIFTTFKKQLRSRLAGIVVLIFSTSGLASAAVVTVSVTAHPGQRNLISSNHAPLSVGNEVRIGFWDAGSFDIAANIGNLPSLSTNFTQFGFSPVNISPGRFGMSPSMDNAAFNGQQIYLWVLETDDGSPVVMGGSNVVNHGIFTDPAWIFPDNNVLGSTLITTGDAGIVGVGAASFTGDPANGTPGSANVLGDATTGSLQIPEPSSVSFLALASVLIFRRRR